MKNIYRLVIAGSRGFDDYDLLKERVDELLSEFSSTYEIFIVSGTARGADSLGEQYALENNYFIEQYPANWNKYGKKAGYIRNEEMAKIADGVIVFWDGKSRGTKHMIDLALKNHKKTIINYY